MKWKTSETVSPLLILTILTLACLLPFIGKAFHIDDPLFLWCARHIQSHPFDFYGFRVNWGGEETPMDVVMQNPPLAAYFMAPAGAVLGWGESALHAWVLLPAVALVTGTWRLARNFCRHPLAAALITLTAPVFLLSSTSVMCDTLMLALWVWAVVFWMAGLAQSSPGRLCIAVLLISACELTKYFGLSLIPLLLVYSLVERKRLWAWMALLLVPILVMVAYQQATRHLYGRGLLYDAAFYATNMRVGGNFLERLMAGMAFCGGCIVILLPLAPALWGRKALVGGIVAVILAGLFAVALKKVNQFPILEAGNVKWFYVVQLSFAVVAGGSLIFLALADWFERRTPDSTLLLLWVAGTFLFSCAVNWTVSGRNILPMLPAVSILLIRRLEGRAGPDPAKFPGRLWLPLGFSLALAMMAVWADYRLAGSARDAAAVIARKASGVSTRLWFEGHWGFQYYMEQQGAKSLDEDHHQAMPRDVVVMPLGNVYRIPLSPDHFDLWFTHEGKTLPWLATMNSTVGAGYYSDLWGPLPYVFCRAPADEYEVFRVK